MKKILVTTLFLIFAANVFAQISYNQEFQVNTYTNYDQGIPSVTGLSNGGFIICWQSWEQDGSALGIYAQTYDQNGIKVGNEFQVNTYTNNYQVSPSVAGLSNGGIIICWESYEQDGSGRGIFAQMYDQNGIKVGNEFQVNTYTNNYQVTPSVAGLSNGGFIICWTSIGQDGSGWGIFAQMYDENGIKIGNEFQVNTYTNHDQGIPSVTGLSNGGFIICWASYEQDGSSAEIFGKYYLGAPINHTLNNFSLLEPQLDASLIYNNPLFKWVNTSNIHLNFPWELTYELYVDNDVSFSNSIILTDLEDTTYQIDSLDPGQTYFWKVLARNYYGDSLWSSDVFGFYIDPNATDIKEIETPLPETFELFQNYPNPFNPTTRIRFTIPAASVMLNSFQHPNGETPKQVRGDNTYVTLKIYDILGNEITTLVNEPKPPGTYEVKFDGAELSSGIYFYKLYSGQYSITKKMLLMK